MIKEEKKEIITEIDIFDDTKVNAESSLSEEKMAEDILLSENIDPNSIQNDKKGKGRRKNERRLSRRPERIRQEFDSKIISLRRVTRVVAGGRRFSFSIAVVVGDKKGRVGVGVGKAGDTPIAVDKAVRLAKKNIITVALSKKNSIPHLVEAKYASARVSIMPAPGKGVVAGSAARTVLELAGIKEVSSKILSRSKNKLNIARATIKALSKLRDKNKHAIS